MFKWFAQDSTVERSSTQCLFLHHELLIINIEGGYDLCTNYWRGGLELLFDAQNILFSAEMHVQEMFYSRTMFIRLLIGRSIFGPASTEGFPRPILPQCKGFEAIQWYTVIV